MGAARGWEGELSTADAMQGEAGGSPHLKHVPASLPGAEL